MNPGQFPRSERFSCTGNDMEEVLKIEAQSNKMTDAQIYSD